MVVLARDLLKNGLDSELKKLISGSGRQSKFNFIYVTNQLSYKFRKKCFLQTNGIKKEEFKGTEV